MRDWDITVRHGRFDEDGTFIPETREERIARLSRNLDHAWEELRKALADEAPKS